MADDASASASAGDDGLRHRNVAASSASAPPPKPAKPVGGGGAGGARGQRGPGEGTFLSEFIKKHMSQVLKVVYALENGVELGIKAYNLVTEKAEVAYKVLEPYHPPALIGMGTGLALCFFGSWFIVTVAMYEAFQQGGAHILYENAALLREQVKNVRAADEADDKLDEDGDGVADVLQISKEELAQRKLIVAIKTVNPVVVSNALGGLWTATVSAAATVKLQFARTIALGVTIGNVLNRPVQRYVVPILESVTPPYLHPWYPSIGNYITRMIGATIAFNIQRVLSTVSTAMRGGHLLIDNFAEFCEKKGLAPWLYEGYIDDVIAWGIVVLGIYTQLFIFTYLPFIIKLALLPLFIVEWLLTTLVTTV